jgi:hypothetical protein
VIQGVRFVNLLTAGLLAGVVLTHPLQWPGMAPLSGAQWLAVQHHLFGGYAVFGAVAEPLAFLLSLGLGVRLARSRSPAEWLPLAAAACFAAMLAIFGLFLQPINLQVAGWTPSSLPADWRRSVDRWSLFHTVSFVLALAGFCALLAETMRGAADGRHR